MVCRVHIGPDPGNKANEIAIEALKQLLTTAVALLAFTSVILTFAHEQLSLSIIQLVALGAGWICLLLSIWMAWFSIADAARRLGTREITGYVFVRGKMPGRLARAAQYLLVLGIVLLTGFAFSVVAFSETTANEIPFWCPTF